MGMAWVWHGRGMGVAWASMGVAWHGCGMYVSWLRHCCGMGVNLHPLGTFCATFSIRILYSSYTTGLAVYRAYSIGVYWHDFRDLASL
jgi:hypothetical protein